MGFFDEQQGAAFYKHALLSGYLRPFASKTGSRSQGGTVAYVDAFAGAGVYEDGSPGSPQLALETAEALTDIRQLRCFFIESKRQNFDRLSSLIARSAASDRVQAFHGDASSYLPSVLSQTAGLPLLAFLDPFGLGIPFDALTGQLMARSGWSAGRRTGPVTEVLVNFVYAGVYRNAAKLHASTTDPTQLANATAVVERVNGNLGGTWWQPIWDSPGATSDRVRRIRDEYCTRVVQAAGAGWKSYRVEVRDTWLGSPVYDLILFTQSPHGLWYINEAASLAWEKFREHCDPDKGQQSLWAPDQTWVSELEQNLHALLKLGDVHVLEQSTDVYGRTLGYARGTHVRRAAINLHKMKMLRDEPKGGFEELVLRPPRGGLPPLMTSSPLFEI